MAPGATLDTTAQQQQNGETDHLLPPALTQARYDKAGIDYKNGYPWFPIKPKFVQEVQAIRSEGYDYVDRALQADPEKKALFGACTEVRHLNYHIGTELVGIQLASLTDQQRDELALLVAERTVVFARNQDLSPQQQLALGEYWGRIEKHPQVAQVPGVGAGVTLIWEKGRRDKLGSGRDFRNPYPSGSYGWHTDLVHEAYPAGYTHLHQDHVPQFGGDTLWASGYAAYDKLSPAFRARLEGLNGVYRSAHKYKDESDPDGELKHVLRVHPLIRTHPVTGWKALWVNRAMTVGIEGWDQAEADAVLNHLHNVYERSVDIQVRWSWTPGASAIWDNRASIHTVSWDYENKVDRHGTRVSTLAEKPFYDPSGRSRREALGLDG